ncbi:Ig-like domain repeat protein [uncultured Methanobrevibacter sp.]|uniref:Ig-like domain repeat protein n=1 Tax=uncultured Methanobrevibacter sp. TaxID=253161 RepID=UPI0026191E68|nr:Ig-like domain repeat protein [uncultured Methanobrevibacter sp.]
MEKTIFKSTLHNKFEFTVTDNSYFVLRNLTMIGVHINNQANLVADNVMFANSVGFNPSNPPALSYSSISKIYDSTYGGVIICDTPSGKITTLDLNDCQFISNSALSGGVIATYNSFANIQNCVFYNSSADRFGGSIYSVKSNLTIHGSYFKSNNAKYGGAIYANCSILDLKDSQFNMSEAFSFGGAIASFSSQLDINHVVFNDFASLNDAGGAIYMVRGTLNVADSLFRDGHSDFGGAICNLMSISSVCDSEFINNTATYYGGSIYNMYGGIALTGNTFTGSNADSGGSIFNRLSDSFRLSNNVFKDSTANEGNIIFIDGDKVNVVESGNVYDNSHVFIKYGNVYDIDYYPAVPLINYSSESISMLPSSYDSRKYGYVTPAKDQIQGGNCWAFAGISTLEACIKKATGIEYDFSEENVKNLMSEYALFDSDDGVNSGGNLYMFIAYLAGWFGPTYDEYDTYDDYSSLSVIYDSIVHVQNVYILPERESFYDNDYIKRAVMQYGAVSIGIDLSENQGHAVTIVGWDDEFASNDFLGNKAVGAWIIKNSWGSNWGYNGFGYLSYQQEISFGYTFIFDDDRGYSNIYQYDYAGKSGFHSIKSDEVYIKNKFTARNDEILSAFSTYFDEPTNFTASIYLNGNLVTTQNGYSQTGYFTIPLVNEVPLKKGDSFEISIKIFNGAPVYLPICTADEINKITFDKGISFYSNDGRNWVDLYESNMPGVACIKAFTRLKSLNEIAIDINQFGGDEDNPLGNVSVGDLVNIQLTLPENYVEDGIACPLEGLVTFTINDQYYYATVENGKACLNFTFEKEGTYNVTAQFQSSRAISNLIDFKVNVLKNAQSNLIIQANDVSKFYGGPEKYVATLSNDGKALSGVNVKVSVDGKNYTLKTDANGQIILDLSLPVGVYYVHLQYGGKTVSSKFAVLSTIVANDLSQEFLDVYASASFLNTEGNVLSNNKVSFNVELYGTNSIPLEYNATTDNVGFANLKLNLYVNKYLVTAINPISGEKKQFILDILPADSTCVVSVTQLGSVVTINANVNPVQASGHVNFLVSGNVYKVNIQKGVAVLRLDNLALGDYNVTAIYSSDSNLRVSSDTKTFSVTDNPYQISSSNYWGYYGVSGTMATITDENGKGIEGEVVKATISNKTYYNTTDKDGNAMFYLDLEVGDYDVLFEYNGQSILHKVFVYSTIDKVDFYGEYLNSKVGAHFIDPDDESNKDFDVKFIVDGKEYSAKTDSTGFASANVDLPVGTYTVTIVNLRNGEQKQSKLTVYKTTPKITLTKSKRGDTLLLTADLAHDSAVGNVVFTMGSNKYTTGVKNGKAILALNVLDEGSYEAYANYIGDYNFNNIISPTIKFDYVRTDYALSASDVSKYYGGPEKFTANLTNFNKPVEGAIITLQIGDESYNITTDSNGIATFDANLDPGLHVFECSFDDKTVKSAVTVKSTITVNGGAGEVSISKISAEIRDGNGDLAKNKKVTFKIGNREYEQITDDLGVATLDASLEKGNYTVTIINTITGETKDSTLVITKTTPTLTLSFVKENGADVLKAVLPKTATGDVIFVLGEGNEYSSEIKEGVSRLEDIDPGEYDVNVIYNGDDNFNPVSKSIKINVAEKPLESVLMSSKVTTTYGTSKNIVVTLIDENDNPLVGRTITVKLNNKVYTATVKSNGQAIVAIPKSLTVKTYVATISYAGEAKVLGATKSVNVVVNKATPKLTAAKKTFKINDKTKKYVVTLKTDKNKVMKKMKVTVKVNKKTYTAKTNSKGQATFKLTKLTKKGTFTATVKYAGNSYYKAVSKNVKITVKK